METFYEGVPHKGYVAGIDPVSDSSPVSIMKIRDDGVLENLEINQSFRSNDRLTSVRIEIIDFSKEEPKDSLITDIEDYEDLPK
jgi:hypothetical protein